MKHKIKVELALIFAVITLIAAFFLVPGTITGFAVLDAQQSLEDVQIHSETQISPTLEVMLIEQPETTPELTYNCIEIKSVEDEFTYAEIFFKVDNKWIKANNLEKQGLALYLFNKTWEQLPTSVEKETEEFTHYKSKTSNIGLFAIAKAVEELPIKESILIEKLLTVKETVKQITITPILILAIAILSLVLIIKLISLLKHKFKFFLITLAFAIMILGLAVQQYITKEILLYGILPVSIIALIISFALAIILNKLRKYRTYPYAKSIVFSVLALFAFITSTTLNYNKEILIYAISPLFSLALIAAPISILTYKIDCKLRNNEVYYNIRNVILSIVLIYAFIKILSPLTPNTFYFVMLPLTIPAMITLFVKYVKNELKEKPVVKKLRLEPPKFESNLSNKNDFAQKITGIKIRDCSYGI